MSDTTKPKNTVGGSKDFARKARELIAMMTLEEKESQLMNATPGIPRLGIPPYDYWNEALHGVARSGVATVFPEPIGLAATFNPSLIEKMADAIATEGRAKYAIARKNGNYARFTGLTYWSPNVNIFRDPRWGRGMETYGEDPFLSGVMGTAFVRDQRKSHHQTYKYTLSFIPPNHRQCSHLLVPKSKQNHHNLPLDFLINTDKDVLHLCNKDNPNR